MSENNVVISSRIRLARNVEGYPFYINDERAAVLARTAIDSARKLEDFKVFPMSKVGGTLEGYALVEKHLISPDLLKNRSGGAAIISSDNTVSIMVGEEDHLREQCIMSGLNLKEAYKRLSVIDGGLNKDIKFAFHAKFGFLTTCLTNIGTGLRASVMMFLPALTLTKTLEQCVNNVTRLNMTIRGVYGEGSEGSGYIYQISNQKTLGITEQDILAAVQSAAEHIVEAELRARQYLLVSAGDELKDKIFRAYGVLKHCYKLGCNEFMQLIALVKLGIYYGFFQLDSSAVERLIVDVQPANLCLKAGKELETAERDLLRAKLVGENLIIIGDMKDAGKN